MGKVDPDLFRRLLLIGGGQVGFVLDLQLHGVLDLLEGLVGLLPSLQQVLGHSGELGVGNLHLEGAIFKQTNHEIVGNV